MAIVLESSDLFTTLNVGMEQELVGKSVGGGGGFTHSGNLFFYWKFSLMSQWKTSNLQWKSQNRSLQKYSCSAADNLLFRCLSAHFPFWVLLPARLHFQDGPLSCLWLSSCSIFMESQVIMYYGKCNLVEAFRLHREEASWEDFWNVSFQVFHFFDGFSTESRFFFFPTKPWNIENLISCLSCFVGEFFAKTCERKYKWLLQFKHSSFFCTFASFYFPMSVIWFHRAHCNIHNEVNKIHAIASVDFASGCRVVYLKENYFKEIIRLIFMCK